MLLVIAYQTTESQIPGATHAGLGIVARSIVEVLRASGVSVELMPVGDGYELRERIRGRREITDVSICAPFFDTDFLLELCLEFHHVSFSIVYHSNVAFLGADNWNTGHLVEQVKLEKKIKNFHVAGNSEKFVEAVRRAFDAPCVLLPNLYFLDGERVHKPLWRPGDILRVGAFGALRSMKNFPTAAWAALIISSDLEAKTEFWVSNGGEPNSAGEDLLENFRRLFRGSDLISLVIAPWAPWREFRSSVVRKMNLLLQPSFTESFNNVTADGIAEGVPSVVGESIDWVPDSWIAPADRAVEIAEAGERLLRDHKAPERGYKALERYNAWGILEWKRFLGIYRF